MFYLDFDIYIFLLFLLFFGGCTEESRNKIFKQADNVLGKDLRISYVADSGKIVKSWTVRDGKVTTHKEEMIIFNGGCQIKKRNNIILLL